MPSPDKNLAHLEVYREFKRKMSLSQPDANVSPFDDRISTSGTTDGDVADIHLEVRRRIRDIISDVRDGKKKPQVILLSGAAGTGKTHLLKTFQTAESMHELGHIFVGGSNHWTIGDFQARLLDWVVEALTAPSPTGDLPANDPSLPAHPLLERVRAIGFRAVEHLLTNPTSWKTCLASPGGRFFGRMIRRWTRPSHSKLQVLVAARDPAVFGYFDFTAFGSYVCDRFLAERSNLLHRFALRVLLTYLFLDKSETGVGTRERVLHWFRGRADDDYFTRRLGASERPDRTYSKFEAVKLLAHLFSPAVSSQLSTDTAPCPPRVLLLTFDQAEGRNELFDKSEDWPKFFAHLSELYNTLPNVVVLFTMTLQLREELHSSMERQFLDRIRMDDKFLLMLPDREQVKSLYRNRVERWLANDVDLLNRYRDLDNAYVPLDAEQVVAVAGIHSMRNTLSAFDDAFHLALTETAVDPEIDYLYARNDLKKFEQQDTDWEYTADHLVTVEKLLDAVGPILFASAGLTAPKIERSRVDSVTLLKFTFTDGAARITFTLARLGYTFKAQIESLIGLFLYDKDKPKNFIKFVRPRPLPADIIPTRYENQIFKGLCLVEVESAFRALCLVVDKSNQYADRGHTAAFEALVRREVDKSYLGNLFTTARTKLNALPGGSINETVSTTPP